MHEPPAATVAALLKASALPPLEARALLAHELQTTREFLLAHPDQPVARERSDRFQQLAARRHAGEPLAYLLGTREFYGRSFHVNPAVLIPRPETELLVQLTLQRATKLRSPRILDLATGSGCIAITLALELADAEVLATDLSEEALAAARVNAQHLGAKVTFVQSDWYQAVVDRYDFIVANPPYVAPGDAHLQALRYEPELALVARNNGLACLSKIIAGAPAHLRASGWLLVEHGYDQAAAVRHMFVSEGLADVSTVRDDANIERVTLGR